MISIILPAHNEQERIATCLFKLGQWAIHRPGQVELIVVANGCTDQTVETALLFAGMASMPLRVMNIPERSKALGVRTGMLAAGGDVLIMADVDLSTPPEEFSRFLQEIDAGADVVIGSRRLAGAHVTQSVKRRVVGWIFSVLTSTILPGIKDTQCGFKAFRRKAGRELFTWLSSRSMAFDVDLLLSARRKGYSIKEIPVTWKENTDSRVRLLSDSYRMAVDVFRLMRIPKQVHRLPEPVQGG